MNAKQRAIELFNHHIKLAKTDGRLFRKTVLEQLMKETGCSVAAAATHYNTAKKMAAPIDGLGRAPVAPGVKKMGGSKQKMGDPEVDDNDCFSVLEIVKKDENFVVGRCQSFILQGDASEKFDEKVEAWPNCTWVMIQGLGPNSEDTFKLAPGEKEIKRYPPVKEELKVEHD